MNAISKVLTVVLLKVQVCWHVALCCWASSWQLAVSSWQLAVGSSQLSEGPRCLLNIRNHSHNDFPKRLQLHNKCKLLTAIGFVSDSAAVIVISGVSLLFSDRQRDSARK